MPLIDEAELAAGIGMLLSTRAPAKPGRQVIRSPGAPGRELRPLGEVLTARRSIYQFSGEPLPLADLEFVAGYAVTMLRAWWPVSPREDEGLMVLAAVFDVAGLPRGLYPVGSGVPLLSYRKSSAGPV